MGGQFSKRSGDSSHGTTRPPTEMNSNSHVIPDLSSYEAACRLDPDLLSFDSNLQQRTSRIINTLAVEVEVRTLSLDSLVEVTGGLAEMNQEVVNVILQSKKDIWNNQELLDLVQGYFENSLVTLDFCNALERCLKPVRESQVIVHVALQHFEVEHRERVDGGERNCYAKTLQELKNFKAAGDPFTEEFFSLFQSVYRQQTLMFKKLQKRKQKLDKKLKSLKAWRKVSNIIFAATFAAVLICSVVAAAIAAPPVVTALAAAASIPLGSMGKWFNSLWKKYENELKGQWEIISSMESGTYIAINDLDSIRVLVDKLDIEIESLLLNADFALREEETVMLAIDEIRKKLSEFTQTIDDLSKHADKFSRDIRRARTVIAHRIIKYPSTN